MEINTLRPLQGQGKKLFVETYGCQMNVGDSEIVVSIMQNEGWRYTDDPREADVILINTCSIRDNAEQRIWGRLRELRQYKKKNKGLLVGVIGCMAERLREKLIDQDAVQEEAIRRAEQNGRMRVMSAGVHTSIGAFEF